jgi:hypothetical protein
MRSQPSISFVFGVESGWLECLTIRAVESLRRWGGAFANAPVFAVVTRGPPLSSATLDTFKRLDVAYVHQPARTPYSWFQYYQKPLVLAAVDTLAKTDTIAWLDSDLLIAGEPEALQLEDDVDFAARPSAKEMGTCGVGDPLDPIWRANCRALGIDIDALPWIMSDDLQAQRIRLYWNSGVFVYRTSTAFGRHWLKTSTRLMEARNFTLANEFKLSFNEMGALGLAMHSNRMRWRSLPRTHNYDINWRALDQYREQDLRAAQVIHHHDFMLPEFWDNFLQLVERTHPPVAKWLATLGPATSDSSLLSRIAGRARKIYYNRAERAYIESCHVVDDKPN